jgi:hypothetical protein
MPDYTAAAMHTQHVHAQPVAVTPVPSIPVGKWDGNWWQFHVQAPWGNCHSGRLITLCVFSIKHRAIPWRQYHMGRQ